MSSTILFLARAKATKSLDMFLMESLASSSLIHSRVFLEDKAYSHKIRHVSLRGLDWTYTLDSGICTAR